MSNKYPKVNYIGNKEKLADWIFENLPSRVESFFDAFSGGASISYAAKIRGLSVTSNDFLTINHLIAKALIENNSIRLDKCDIDIIFSGKPTKGFMFNNYANVYYHPEECMQLDLIRQNINKLHCDYKKALALILMRRAMIRKMPYSRFTIDWDKIKQLRDEDYSYEKYKRRRAYHNQTFEYHFLKELSSYNNAVFDNGKMHISYNNDIFDIISKVKADVIYLDPPYIGTMNNYQGFYGLLDAYISSEKPPVLDNDFTNKKNAIDQFDALFSKMKSFKYWMLSYNNKSYPSKNELLDLIKKYSDNITVIEKPYTYKTTGKEKKHTDIEYLFIVQYKTT